MKKYRPILVAMVMVFTSIAADAYYWLSPYSYCGNNPVNCVDPDGEDIVVLNYTEGQHMAMLIQDENGKWQYYSVNGDNVYVSGEHKGGRPFNDVAVGTWDSPEEFFHSSYNIRTESSKEDKTKNHFGYSEGFHIPSTPQQDAIMRAGFSEIAKTNYNLFFNNCATAVQKVMIEAGIPVSEPQIEQSTFPMSTSFGIVEVFRGYKMKCVINPIPRWAFKTIMNWNPDGKYIHK